MRRRSAADKNPVGIDFDPEELVKKIHTGLRFEELPRCGRGALAQFTRR